MFRGARTDGVGGLCVGSGTDVVPRVCGGGGLQDSGGRHPWDYGSFREVSSGRDPLGTDGIVSILVAFPKSLGNA